MRADRRDCLRAAAVRYASELRLAPADADAWYELGSALAELGDRAGACIALRHAAELDARRARSQLALGRLLFDCGQVDRAIECFLRADSIEAA